MLAFLKRWRQAYLEDKGNRLHAEAAKDEDLLCKNKVMDTEKAAQLLVTLSKKKQDADLYLQLCERSNQYYN